MSMTKRWSLLTAVLIVGILAASWFLLVAPKRSEAAEIRGKATAQKANNEALVLKLNELKSQSLELPKQKAQLAVMRKQIPSNPALPTLIRTLTAAGQKVGVQLLSMKPGTPAQSTTVVTAPVAPAGTAAAGTAAAGTTSTGATPTAAPAPAASPLYVVPLALEVTGSYFEVEQFINKLEGMQRTFLLQGFSLKPSSAAAGATTAADDLSLSLTGEVFLSPNVDTTSTTAVAPNAAQAQ
jgi:Tfp pilus assembly protein PilO